LDVAMATTLLQSHFNVKFHLEVIELDEYSLNYW